MTNLTKSRSGRSPYVGLELLACGKCFGETFREEGDAFGERFRLYRDEMGTIVRTTRTADARCPAMGLVVCCTCEDMAEEEAAAGKRVGQLNHFA